MKKKKIKADVIWLAVIQEIEQSAINFYAFTMPVKHARLHRIGNSLEFEAFSGITLSCAKNKLYQVREGHKNAFYLLKIEMILILESVW